MEESSQHQIILMAEDSKINGVPIYTEAVSLMETLKRGQILAELSFRKSFFLFFVGPRSIL